MENKKNGCEHLRVSRSSNPPTHRLILIHSTGASRHSIQPCRRRTPPLSRRRKRPLGSHLQLHPRIPQPNHHNPRKSINFPQSPKRTMIRNPPSSERAFHFHRSTTTLPIDRPPPRHQRRPLRSHRCRQPHRPLQQRLGPPSLHPQIHNKAISSRPARKQHRNHQPSATRSNSSTAPAYPQKPPPRRPLTSSSRHVVDGPPLRHDILPAPEQ